VHVTAVCLHADDGEEDVKNVIEDSAAVGVELLDFGMYD